MGIDDNDESRFFHHKSNSDINSKVMLTAIISLSLVVIFVTILHIYARCLLRRQARRQAALRRFGFITAASANIQTAETPKTGLDPSVIAALPVFVFKRTTLTNDDENETSFTECSVCLSMMEDGEIARTLPNCKHTFHAECIDQWFGTNSTCPICRMNAEPMLPVAEPREGIVGGAPPSAPPQEGTSDGGGGGMHVPAKISGSSRLSSFRRMLSRERSSRRMQSTDPDLERQ